MEVPVEESVKVTSRGAVPESGVPVNAATGTMESRYEDIIGPELRVGSPGIGYREVNGICAGDWCTGEMDW